MGLSIITLAINFSYAGSLVNSNGERLTAQCTNSQCEIVEVIESRAGGVIYSGETLDAKKDVCQNRDTSYKKWASNLRSNLFGFTIWSIEYAKQDDYNILVDACRVAGSAAIDLIKSPMILIMFGSRLGETINEDITTRKSLNHLFKVDDYSSKEIDGYTYSLITEALSYANQN